MILDLKDVQFLVDSSGNPSGVLITPWAWARLAELLSLPPLTINKNIASSLSFPSDIQDLEANQLRHQFERHIGGVSLGHPTNMNNDQIDADIASQI